MKSPKPKPKSPKASPPPPPPPKRKRGRPRIEGYESAFFPKLHSEQARQNHYYAAIAMDALGVSYDGPHINMPARYRYFMPGGDTDDPFWRAKWDVLAQLGRVNLRGHRKYNHAVIRYFADQICKLNPRAKTAVQEIRSWRNSLDWQITTAPFEGCKVDIALFAHRAVHQSTEYWRPANWREMLRSFRSMVRREAIKAGR